MAEGDPLCTTPRLEPPVQVHPSHHHAEDVAVALAKRADVVDAREKRFKNSFIHQKVLVTCVADVETKLLPNAN